METHHIRQTFVNTFANQGYTVVPAGPLVPKDDASVLLTNSGMNPFKFFFTGEKKPPWPKAVSCQPCIRAGGKHNDLNQVGLTTRHNTFFEMLGTFSFGTSSKEQAIVEAWTFLTQHLQLPPKKLYVTFYAQDAETQVLWKKISALPDRQILAISTLDNFWSMGATGPCGPCSEIFYDHGPHLFGGPPGSQHEDGERFVELWNLVFMTHNQGKTQRIPLSSLSIDTGMSLERMAAVLQGVHSNYDTDVFKAIISHVAHLYCQHTISISHRVLADHIRAIGFLIAEGVFPAAEGRGYVLRRIMRRAMRHSHLLGATQPMLGGIAQALVNIMGPFFPQLTQHEATIKHVIQEEEVQFQHTLQKGLAVLDKVLPDLKPQESLSGELAFKLYDTYGMPLDVTQDIVAPRQVDVQGFNKAMAHQKQQARASWKGQADHNDFYTQLAQKYSNTTFVGYHKHCEQTQIQALWTQDEVFQKTVSAPCCFFLLVNSTPLYAQSGGQEADHGIFCTDTAQGVIDDVQKTPGGALVYHRGRLTTGVLTKGQHITLTLNAKRRWGLAIHHSATHLLHQALRHHLGLHVLQKGSLVAQERLRFDFSHTQPVALQQKQHIMAEINKKIQENLSVSTETLSLKQAQQKGALALFDQRYADTVRVVSMGDYSLELCGGTHVPSTGVIGAVYITNETSVATGIRRMEAVAGPGLLSRLMYAEESLHDTARILKVSVKNLTSAAKKLVSCNPPLHKTPSSVQQHPTTTTEIWGGYADDLPHHV